MNPLDHLSPLWRMEEVQGWRGGGLFDGTLTAAAQINIVFAPRLASGINCGRTHQYLRILRKNAREAVNGFERKIISAGRMK